METLIDNGLSPNDESRRFVLEAKGSVDNIAAFFKDLLLDAEIEKDKYGISMSIIDNGVSEDANTTEKEEVMACSVETLSKIGQKCKTCD